MRRVTKVLTCRRSLNIGPLALLALALSALAPVIAQEQVDVAATLAFTEGPTADRDGNVYFSEMVNQRIMKLSPSGVLSTFREKSNNANGLVIDPEGRLIACEGAETNRNGVRTTNMPRITRTNLRTGQIEILADSFQGAPLKGPNDVTIDSKGRIYFTDLSGSAVYRIDAPGKLARLAAAPDVQRPNGIQISPDDTKLYVADSSAPPDGVRVLYVFDLQADGSVRNKRVLYDFLKVRGIDGMSIDVQGNLYGSAGSRATGNTGIHVISPQGKVLRIIPIPEDPISNNAFGGPDMKTLYVTAGKTLYKVRTEIAGLPR
jgi:gluconolactonase